MNYQLKTARIVRFEQFAQGGKKLSNIFEYFHLVFEYFISVFEYFRTFSNVFERFLHELARLVRKSTLLIEILPLMRINSRPAEALAKADARLIEHFTQNLPHSCPTNSCPNPLNLDNT